MIKKLNIVILVILALLILGACGNNDEQMQTQMKPVLSYTSDKEENIRFVRTKEYDGLTIREFTDSKYFYEVTPDGKLMTIFLRTTPNNISPNMATQEEIRLRTEDNLRRLDYDLEKFKTDIRYSESKKQYESVSRERQGEYFTGNNVYIQFTNDGTLISISFKHENPDVLNNIDKISVDEAKEIVINYFSTNASTEKYSSQLSKEIIRYDVDVYNNKKVYNLYFSLNTEEQGTFDFNYIVSTETGIILYRKELR